jgi:hypothetical protein
MLQAQHFHYNFTTILNRHVIISSHIDLPLTLLYYIFTIHNLTLQHCCESIVFVTLLGKLIYKKIMERIGTWGWIIISFKNILYKNIIII